MMERAKVLITGATGFLGNYLVKELLPDFSVYALGRNEEKGKRLEEMGAHFCRGDFTDARACAPFFDGMDYVIHAGALSTVWGKWQDFYQTNVKGTEAVGELCLRCGVRRMVYISSPSVYTCAADRYQVKEEDADQGNTLNYYIRSKLLAEERIGRLCRRGLDAVILRPRGLIGPGDTSLVPRILRANSKIGIPLLNGGRNLVDITCVETAAYACRLAMLANGCSGQIYNITNGEPMEFQNILELFLAAIGEKPRYLRLPFGLLYRLSGLMELLYGGLRLSGEPMLTKYTVCTLGFGQTLDITKAERDLGFRPPVSLRDGIRAYGKWWRQQ